MFMCSFFTCYRFGCTSSLQGSIISLLPLQSADTFDMLHFALFLCAYCFNFYSIGYIRALKITWLGSRKGCSLAAKAIFYLFIQAKSSNISKQKPSMYDTLQWTKSLNANFWIFKRLFPFKTKTCSITSKHWCFKWWAATFGCIPCCLILLERDVCVSMAF